MKDKPKQAVERAAPAALPTRRLRSPWFVHTASIGGHYLDPTCNQQLVRHPREAIAKFLADAKLVPVPGERVGDVKYADRPGQRPLCYLHEGALQAFEQAAQQFLQGTPGMDAASQRLRREFRLPDPDEEPDAYWVAGDRFNPQLMILWGCEKKKGSALPLWSATPETKTVVSQLRARAMNWTRLFREGIEFCLAKRDPLAAYLAFPVFDADGEMTHVQRLVDGQFQAFEVGRRWTEKDKVCPLKDMPAGRLPEFLRVAEEFYRQARGPAPLTYEQEIRRGFRLPDPARRPDAYMIHGHPSDGQLLILCPPPAVKDQEEIAHLLADVEWAEKIAQTAEDRAAAQKLRADYDEARALNKLYLKFLYSPEDCLCLTADKELGLPVAAPKSSSPLTPAPATATKADAGEATVVARLAARRIQWNRLFREGLQFTLANDPLRDYLAFPVLDADGRLTHVQRVVGGQYVRDPVRAGLLQAGRVRPLKAMPAARVAEFRKAAADFYRKAHPKGCPCPVCTPGGGEAASAAPARPARTSSAPPTYEEELRRGFRLPSPARRGDAFYVRGRPLDGRLLVLCPPPDVLDQAELAELLADVEESEATAKTAEQTAKAAEKRAAYDAALTQHKRHERWFYSEEECLFLTADDALGLPPAPAPGTLPAEAGPAAGPRTVAEGLRLINWAALGAVAGVVLALFIGAGVAAFRAWPRQLLVTGLSVANDRVNDPENRRNLIRVEFSATLGEKLFGRDQGPPPASVLGKYTLRRDGKDIKLRQPKPLDAKSVQLELDPTAPPLQDGVTYELTAELARDIFGNRLASTNARFAFKDQRGPAMIGTPAPPSEDATDTVKLEFDEPLDKISAESTANYVIGGAVIKSAKLLTNRTEVVVQIDKPFESQGTYTLKLLNIADAAQGRNPIAVTDTNFVFAQVPLKLRSVAAADVQYRAQVSFNKALPRELLTGLASYKVDGLQVGAVLPLDDRSVELVFTNSALQPGSNYVLQIVKLRDPTAKAGAGLTTNAPFSFTGTADKEAPRLLEVSSVSNSLRLTFSEDLRADAARLPANYVLKVAATGGDYTKRFVPEVVSPTVVRLKFPDGLDSGSFKITYPGVADLAGNQPAPDAAYDFKSASMVLGINSLKAAELAADGTIIRLKLRGRLDLSCQKPGNFTLVEGGAGTSVTAAKFSPQTGFTDIELTLSANLTATKFTVRFQNLKLEGYVNEYSGDAPSGVQ